MIKCIFMNENIWIPIEISLKCVPKGSINNNPSLFQILAWRRPGDKPLSEPMMVSSLTHICVTRPQWVKCCIITSTICVAFGVMSLHTFQHAHLHIISYPTGATIMRQWTGSTLVQAWFVTCLAPRPYLNQCWLIDCQWDPWEQTLIKFESKYKIFNFHSWKCIWKCRLRCSAHCVQRGDELISNANWGRVGKYQLGIIPWWRN